MADIEIIIDQRDRVLGAIAPYFAQHPSWKHLVEALCLPFREIEDAIALLVFGQLVLKNATGVWLDRWGTVINQPRGGLADQEYRMALLGGFRGLMSTGNAEDMMGTWKSLMEDSGFEVSLTDIYPAGVILHALRGAPHGEEMLARVRSIMEDAKPGGVNLHLSQAPDIPFGFAGNPIAAGFNRGGFARSF